MNLAATLTSLGAAATTLGLEGLVVRELVRTPEKTGAILGTALRLRFAAGVVMWLALGVVAMQVPAWAGASTVVWCAAASLWFSPAEVIDLWFQRHLESRRTAVVRFVAIVISSAARIGLVAANASATAFGAVLAAEAALLAGLLALSLRRSGRATGPWSWDRTVAGELLRPGLPLAISGVVVVLALRLDQLLVVGWLGQEEAGVYFSSAKLVEVALLAGSALTLSFFPRLSEAHAARSPEFPQRLQAMFDAMTALGWFVAIAATLFGPWLVPLAFGEAYRPAVPALVVLSWGAIVAFNAAARWQYILLAAPTSLNLWCALVGVAVQACLAPWLLARWGIVGAALGWSAGVWASGWVTSFLFPALRPVARAQSRAVLIPLAPGRWAALLASFK